MHPIHAGRVDCRKAFDYMQPALLPQVVEPGSLSGRLPPVMVTPADVVLDTNVVLDLWVFCDARCEALRTELQRGALRWVATAVMLEELGFVLRGNALRRWCAAPQSVLQQLAQACRLEATVSTGADRAPVCTDRDDQVFIDLAWRLRTPWLFTRDRALLKLAKRARARGVQVATPEAWTLQAKASPAQLTKTPAP